MLRLCVSLLTFKEFMIQDLGVNVLRLGSTSPSCSWFQVFGFGEGRFGIRVLEHLRFSHYKGNRWLASFIKG